MLVHHVFFFLNNPDSADDKAQLIEGLRTMTGIDGLVQYHIGQPANTHREVVDRSYQVSWLTLFESAEAQDRYQDDPIHHAFVKNCAHLWEKVVVYDSI